MTETCCIHQDTRSLSTCRSCHQLYCSDCLVEGKHYYYCRQADCLAEMRRSGDELVEPQAQTTAGELVTIARYSYTYQADIARARLEAEGIPAFAADEFFLGLNWLYSNAIGGVRLQVAASDAAAAREILSADLSEEIDSDLPGDDSEL